MENVYIALPLPPPLFTTEEKRITAFVSMPLLLELFNKTSSFARAFDYVTALDFAELLTVGIMGQWLRSGPAITCKLKVYNLALRGDGLQFKFSKACSLDL